VNNSGHPLKGRLGATIGVIYPGCHRPLVMAKKIEYDLFPPVADSWGNKHLIPDMVPLLLAEEERPPT
jgi:hypothetical protein